jgi:xylan 1,4-beta-xylosidase
LPSLGKQALLVKQEVGGSHANPMQTWSNLGKPRSLSKEQLKILQASASCNHLCMLEITPVHDKTDTYLGYDPEELYGMV